MSTAVIEAPSAVVWVLADAIDLVRDIQPELHAHKWHCALGGGVLNRGESSKDADLYILPFSDRSDVPDVMPLLAARWGASEPIGYGSSAIFAHKVKFAVRGGKRIDVFVGRSGGEVNA